jgi:hypothetical protein
MWRCKKVTQNITGISATIDPTISERSRKPAAMQRHTVIATLSQNPIAP